MMAIDVGWLEGQTVGSSLGSWKWLVWVRVGTESKQRGNIPRICNSSDDITRHSTMTFDSS